MTNWTPTPDVECPYCGAGQEICHDDGYGYEEDRIHEQDCGKCGKTFAFNTSISFYYEAWKADCLNGGKHNFQEVRTYPKYYKHWVRCEDCGFEERSDPMTQEEWDDCLKQKK